MAPRERRSDSATVTASDDAAPGGARRPFLYLVLECRRPAAGGARYALDDVDEVRVGRGEERRSSRRAEDVPTLHLEVPDGKMSTRHARLARLAGAWAFQDLGSKNGSRINGEPRARATLRDGDLLELGETLFLFREEVAPGEGDLLAPRPFAEGLATLSPTVAAEYARIAAVAPAPVSVLLQGETGTGKELAARAIHDLSGRRGRFVAVNCGALPSTLLEAELFGHRRGAFSGAVESRLGLIRSADEGTLFLDEIGDLAVASQAALLRALQEKEVLPVGETSPVRVDIRVIAATHHDVAALADAGRFRLDLLARLDGFSARLPPLRDRRADLGILIAALLGRLAPRRASALELQGRVARSLALHDWPRNVRELEQTLAAAVALASDDVIELEHLPERLRRPASQLAPAGPATSSSSAPRAPRSLSPEDAELRARIEHLLDAHEGSVNAVARAMGKDRTQIRRWLARLEIDPGRWR